ncbi:L-threonylcarbamoyladenylate synthase [Paracoccus alkanivorans]|uniref:Threonylcarbamoyl-AMP synthase n=1 Tax=Paracoccus alkanivorans TaxID=2116655 RepID=A0A3M0MIB3_9RHOB|nr:L-threonylcarbamoyladenylate synthase [Paracoccus alkanivorans]RMC37319.1 threonylcarbamoyl-AMP synthase [Paracoccus alkanivorans]
MIIHHSDARALPLAVDLLSRQDLVAVPTETVYGLAGLSTSPEAIAKIYAAKNRPQGNPLISHVADIAMAERYAVFDPISRRLAESFWPGPLTLILPLRDGKGIDRSSTAGRELVALRAPKGFAHDVIAQLGMPVAAPSANLSGRISPTTARHVADDLGERILLIIDGGPTSLGVESTVIHVGDTGVAILRPGALTADILAEVADAPLTEVAKDAEKLSPGMMSSHYAPRASLRLDARRIEPGEAVLGFGQDPIAGIEAAAEVFNLSPSGDLAEAARNLFDLMHKADAIGVHSIAVAPIPQRGMGLAINDRLRRAAAPRS